jgi:hypothetical protein
MRWVIAAIALALVAACVPATEMQLAPHDIVLPASAVNVTVR